MDLGLQEAMKNTGNGKYVDKCKNVFLFSRFFKKQLFNAEFIILNCRFYSVSGYKMYDNSSTKKGDEENYFKGLIFYEVSQK